MNSESAKTLGILESSITRSPYEQMLGGRLSRFAGQIFSFAPSFTQSLKFSVSTLALGTIVTTSLIGGEAHSQSCTVTTDNALRANNWNCTQSSISGSLSMFGGIWGGGAGQINIDLSASTNVNVSTGTVAIFRFGSQGSASLRFTQAANGQDIVATSNVPIAIEAFHPYGNSSYVDAGNSPITISVTGDISVLNSSNYAVKAYRQAGTGSNVPTLGTTITINLADVTAGGGAVYTKSKGSVSITAGNITASGKHAIKIVHDEQNSGSITISASSITVSGNNNKAIDFGNGSKGPTISINVGTITHTSRSVSGSLTGDGISLIASTTQDTSDKSMTVIVGSAYVGDKVLNISTGRTGTITFSSTGAIIGRGAVTINSYGPVNVDLNSFSARTDTSANYVVSINAKTVSVTSSGTISAKSRAMSLNASGNITVSATGDVSTSENTHTIYAGLRSNFSGSATISVTTTGDVTNTSGSNLGAIFVKGNASSEIEISANNVTSSGYYAISVDNNNGSVTITTTGEVKATNTSASSGLVWAINVNNSASNSQASPTAEINLNSGSVVGTSGKGAIFVSRDNSSAAIVAATITVNSGASLIGSVRLSGGDDEIKFNGGSYTLGGSQKINGGEKPNDNDILNFNSGTWTVTATNFTNWETLKIGTDATAKFLGKGSSAGQDLGFSNVEVDGVLSLQDGTVGDNLDISGNLSGNGVIYVDVNFNTKTSDQVAISGTISGNIKIRLNDVTPTGSAHVVDSNIRIISLNGTNQNTSAFSVENTAFAAGGYRYTVLVTSNQYIELQSAPGVLRCTESNSNSGQFTCSGTISATENIVKSGSTNIVATLDDSATVNVAAGVAFTIRGGNGISFTQETGGGTISGGANATGIIDARTTGNGNVSITTLGAVTLAGSGTAIKAESSGTGNVAVSVANVTASHSSGNAINVQGAGTSITVSTNAVSAGQDAIFANATGASSTITINTSGNLTASSGRGIYARSISGDITINTSGSVIGNPKGIEVKATGAGDIDLTISGDVSAGTQGGRVAIDTMTNGGSATIKIHSGTITGGGNAILNDEGASNVILYSGAVISGNISLGGGADMLTLSGATRDANAIFSGGTNSDTTPENDNIVFNAGSTAWDASKFTLWEKITIGASGTLTFNNTTNLTGIALSLDGIASLKDDATGDTLILGGSLTGPSATTGGIFHIDVNFQTGATDTITIGGNVSGQHIIRVNNITPSNATTATSNPITVFSVTGTVSATAISIESGPVGIGGRIFQHSFNSASRTISIITRPGASECEESTTVTGEFSCEGTISTSEYMIAFSNNSITATLDSSATVNVQDGLAFYLSGRGNLTFTQEASGNQITGSGSATGLVHANTAGDGNIAITLTNTASLASSGTAIKATTTGSGNVTISAVDVTASNASGTAIETSADGGNIAISVATTVGGKAGIVAMNMGTSGALTISTTQTVTSSGGIGIDAYNKGNGNIIISATGNISANSYGIKAVQNNSGNITVTSSGEIVNNSASSKQGIFARINGDSSSGDISVVANEVSASNHGIDAAHAGTGSISITSSGSITGSINGITAVHKGSGAGNVSVTSSAAVTGNSGNAIYAYNKNGAISINTSGTVTGSVDGIKVINKHSGAGSATISVSGNVTGTEGNGIDLYKSSQGNLVLTATGDISGKNNGILATNKTSGNLSINVTGAVTNQSASANDALRVLGEGVGNIEVTTTVVTGDDEGVEIRGLGTGTLAATLNGAVTGNGTAATDAGILIYNKAGAGAVTLTVGGSGTVQGSNGIMIDNMSSSTTTINVSGAVTGRTEDGIDATAKDGNLSIVVNANVTGANGKIGIDTHTDGGATSIVLNGGTVTAASGTAIRNDEGNSSLNVNSRATVATNVSLGGGIDTITFSGGTIASGVTLDGGTDNGTNSSVDVINFASATTALTGVNLVNWERVNASSGSTISFDGTNTVSATQFNIAGTLSMRDSAPGDQLTLAGTVSGNSILYIDANFGTGSVDTLSVSGNLTGTITIEVNDITPSNVTTRTENPITIVTVTGSVNSNSVNLGLGNNIRSRNYLYTLSFNSSSKTFVLTGEVGTTSCDTTSGGLNYSCSGAITSQENLIAAGDNDVATTLNRTATVNVSAFTAFALSGRKNISFTQQASGNALNATGSAIGVIHSDTAGSGNTTIVLTGTANLQGSGTAVKAMSTGSGNISVRVSDVTATHTAATAIMAKGSGSNVSVHASAVNGGKEAIVAENSSTGAVSVTTTGAVTTSGSAAIMVMSSGNIDINSSATVTASDASATAVMATGNGSNVNVRVAAASAGNEAIAAINSGSGAVSVTTTGAVSSSGANAIKAMSSGNVSVNAGANVNASNASGTAITAIGAGTSVTVRAATTSAGGQAIHAMNTSTGSVSVVTNGTIRSSGASAIRAMGSGDITVNASGSVRGNNIGIHAQAMGTTGSNIRISSSALVSGQTGAGIHASNVGQGSITISASGVTGQTDGIIAAHTGSGAITVNTYGAIIGTTEYGLNLRNSSNGTNINVTAVSSVSGAKGGILVRNSGRGSVSVTTRGAVSSSATGNHGISVDHTGTGNVSVTVAGMVKGGSNGVGIYAKTNSGSTNIVLNSGAVISSEGGTAIRHGDGNLSVTLNQGATISGIVELGGGTDTLRISGGTVRASRLDGGEDQGTDRSIDVLTFASGSSSLNTSRFVNWERISFASGSTVSVNGAITVDTNELDLKGTLSMQDNQSNDSLTVNGNLAGGGTLRIDVDFSSGQSDSITVSGNATGATTIAIADITPTNAASRINMITIATVNGDSSATSFALEGGNQFLSAGYLYRLNFDDANNSYQVRGTSIIGTLLLSAPIALFDGFAKAPSLHQRLGGIDRQWLAGDSKQKFWMRTVSKNNEYSKSIVTNASYDNSSLGFQIGSDSLLYEDDNGFWVMGFNLSNYQVDSTIGFNTISGDLEASGFGVGGTATWYGKTGHFIDVQFQLNRISTNIDTSILPDLVDADASTAIYLSSEFGYQVMSINNIDISAQTQLSWGHIGLGNVNTTAGTINLHMEDGFTVRAGVLAEFQQDSLGWYAIGNLIVDTPDRWFTSYSGETFLDETSAMLVEFSAGISSQVANNTSLFAQANLSTSIDGRDNKRNSGGISAGLKLSW